MKLVKSNMQNTPPDLSVAHGREAVIVRGDGNVNRNEQSTWRRIRHAAVRRELFAVWCPVTDT
jgi:hypothetical protein